MIHSSMDLTDIIADAPDPTSTRRAYEPVSTPVSASRHSLARVSDVAPPAASNDRSCFGLSEKKRQRMLLLAINFVCGAITMLMPVLVIKNIKLTRPDIHFFHLGGVFVTFYLANTVTSLYVTSRVKNWHTQKLYLSGLALQSVSLLLFGCASKLHSDAGFLAVVYFQRVLEAIACSLINGCGQTMLLNLFPAKNMRNMSWFDIAFSAGTFLGPYVIEYMYEVGSLLAAYVFMGSLQFALCIVAELVLRLTCSRSKSSSTLRLAEPKAASQHSIPSVVGAETATATAATAAAAATTSQASVSLYKLIRVPAFWLALLPTMGTNLACTVVDVGLSSYLAETIVNSTTEASAFRMLLSEYSLQFVFDATPFFSANLCFFLCSMTVGIFAKKVEQYRLVMMVSGVLMTGLGCTIMGVWPTYWVFCVGMALIGGGFAPPMTCSSVTMICIGRNLGLTDKDMRAAAPHIIDTAAAFSKTVGYIAAAVLIRQLLYPNSSVWIGAFIVALSVCFGSSFLPVNSRWMMPRREEAQPKAFGELRLADCEPTQQPEAETVAAPPTHHAVEV